MKTTTVIKSIIVTLLTSGFWLGELKNWPVSLHLSTLPVEQCILSIPIWINAWPAIFRKISRWEREGEEGEGGTITYALHQSSPNSVLGAKYGIWKSFPSPWAKLIIPPKHSILNWFWHSNAQGSCICPDILLHSFLGCWSIQETTESILCQDQLEKMYCHLWCQWHGE